MYFIAYIVLYADRSRMADYGTAMANPRKQDGRLTRNEMADSRDEMADSRDEMADSRDEMAD